MRRRSPRACSALRRRRSRSFDTGYWTLLLAARTNRRRSTTSSTSSSCSRSSRRATRASQTLRRGSPRISTQPPAFRLANASLGALRFWLSKPATRAGEHRRRPDRSGSRSAAAGTRSRGTSRSAPGVYPVHVTAVDWAGEPRVVRCAADRARDGDRSRERRAHEPRRRRSRAEGRSRSVRRSTIRPRARRCRSSVLQLARIGVTWPAGATDTRPECRRRLAAPARRARQRGRVDSRATAGRRRGARCARSVRRDTRAADARPAVARPCARADDRNGERLCARVRPDPHRGADGCCPTCRSASGSTVR